MPATATSLARPITLFICAFWTSRANPHAGKETFSQLQPVTITAWFWILQAPLAQALGPALWTAIGYLAALLATGAALFHLSMVLWKSRITALLTLLVLAPAQFALGGVSTLDPLLLNRTAALPLEIFSIAALAAGRSPLSFAVLGLAANLHIPSAAALAAALTAVHPAQDQASKRHQHVGLEAGPHPPAMPAGCEPSESSNG